MLDIGIGISIEENSLLAAEDAIRQAKVRLKNRRKIDLGIVFNSSDLSAPNIIKASNNLFENAPVIGATGSAIITEKGIFKHGIVAMALGFSDGVYCSTAATKNIHTKNSVASGKELTEKLLYGFKNIPRNFALLFFDRLQEEGTNFIAGIQENLGKSFPCFGVCVSGSGEAQKSSLYCNTEELNDSCVGILWGGKVSFGLGIQHGWKPLGKPHTATSAIGNIVNAIDERPAVKLYEDYLGRDVGHLKRELKKLSVSYPIGVYLPGEQEYLLRNVLSIDDRGALLCQGNIPDKATIRLMISTKETCLEATAQAIDEAQQNINNSAVLHQKGDTSRFAIVFSSVSRYNLLRRQAKNELRVIKNSLGDIPMIGMYTQSEIAPLTSSAYRGQVYFHNQDFSVLIVEG